MAGSLSHVNTKTVSCQRSYGRDKLIASLEQERVLSSRGPWMGFPHVDGAGVEGWGAKRCLMDLGFISRRLSCSFIVNPSNPEKAFAQRFTFFTLQKCECMSTHKGVQSNTKTNTHTHTRLSCCEHNIPGRQVYSPRCSVASTQTLLQKVIFP